MADLNKILILVLISGFVLAGCTPEVKMKNAQPSPEIVTGNTASDHSMHMFSIATEKDFILQMIPHHKEAIDTSQILLAETSDQELKKFAQEVVTVQTAEIKQMNDWLKAWYNMYYTDDGSYILMMGDLTTLQGTELEKKYIEGMIVHHQGAVDMATAVLKLDPAPRSEIQKVATDIISVQTKEIETLQKWLTTKYAAASNSPTIDHSNMQH